MQLRVLYKYRTGTEYIPEQYKQYDGKPHQATSSHPAMPYPYARTDLVLVLFIRLLHAVDDKSPGYFKLVLVQYKYLYYVLGTVYYSKLIALLPPRLYP